MAAIVDDESMGSQNSVNFNPIQNAIAAILAGDVVDDDDDEFFGIPLNALNLAPAAASTFYLLCQQFSPHLQFTPRMPALLEMSPQLFSTWTELSRPIRAEFKHNYGDGDDVFVHLNRRHRALHFNQVVNQDNCWPGGLVVFGFYLQNQGLFIPLNHTHHSYQEVSSSINACIVFEWFDILPNIAGHLNVPLMQHTVRILHYRRANGISFESAGSYDVPMYPRIYGSWRDLTLRFNFERHILFGSERNPNIPSYLENAHYFEDETEHNFWPGAVTIFGCLQHSADPTAPYFYPFPQAHHLFQDVRDSINAVVVLDFF